MADSNGNAQRTDPIPLTVLGEPDTAGDLEDTYIVVGEAGEDMAFEICEDLEIALHVRDAMREDGFHVRLFQAIEVEVEETDDEPGGTDLHIA